MAIENDKWKISKVFQKINDFDLVLPNFQRGFVWSVSKQASLLKSLLVKLPVGALLILDGKRDAFQKRKLCLKDGLVVENKDRHDYLLDGQQRLSTISSIFSDPYAGAEDWNEIHNSLYGTLRNRWFLKIDGDSNDWFGLKHLNFKGIDHLIDTDLDDYIETKAIYKKNINEPYHPAYSSNKQHESKSAQLRVELARLYAGDYLVPLYELADKSSSLITETLKEIASRRERKLMAELEDSGFPQPELCNLFNLSEDDAKEFSMRLIDRNKNALEHLNGLLIEKRLQWAVDIGNFLNHIPSLNLPIIYLDSSEAERAVAIFEAINQGGEPLSVFDLVVAKSAQSTDVSNLADEIFKLLNTPIQIHAELSKSFIDYRSEQDEDAIWTPNALNLTSNNFPSKRVKDWFINILSLLVHVKKNSQPIRLDHIKRDKILSLKSQEISENWERATIALIRSLAFAQFRCGVTTVNDINYTLMIVVLAYHLDEDAIWNSSEKLDRMEYWWWINIFGGGYILKQNEVCIDDIFKLEDFLYNSRSTKYNNLRKDVFSLQNYSDVELILRKKEGRKEPAVVSNGLMSYILRKCPYDWLSIVQEDNKLPRLSAWQASEEEPKVEKHHIIPISHGGSIGESTRELREDSEHILNSPFNFTMISNHANRLISNRSAQDYLDLLEKADRRILKSHSIPSDFKNQIATHEYFLRQRGLELTDSIIEYVDSLLL